MKTGYKNVEICPILLINKCFYPIENDIFNAFYRAVKWTHFIAFTFIFESSEIMLNGNLQLALARQQTPINSKISK